MCDILMYVIPVTAVERRIRYIFSGNAVVLVWTIYYGSNAVLLVWPSLTSVHEHGDLLLLAFLLFLVLGPEFESISMGRFLPAFRLL